MSSGAVLNCQGLTFWHDRKTTPVFQDVSLCVNRGEAVVLTGPSGCGKSTLAYCLAGLYPEYAGAMDGRVTCGGEDVHEMLPHERARRVSLLFQNPDDQFCMDKANHELLFALENVNYRGDMPARARELLSFTGAGHVEGEPLGYLSGGTKQKVALASALATDPAVLIADEPFANVDPDAAREIAERLGELVAAGLGLLIVDHKLEYWRDIASRVIVMDNGGLKDAIPIGSVREHGLFPDGGYEGLRPTYPSEHDIAVEFHEISAGYGKKSVLRDCSAEIPKETVTALVGKNGSGKTTLLWAIAGLLKSCGPIRRSGKIGLIFQNPAFQFLTQSVLGEIVFSLRAQSPGADEDALRERALELLDGFALDGCAQRSPYALSQGQQRRLAVLSMLACGHKILLMDEPTYAQDEASTRLILKLLSESVQNGATVIFSTHDHALARAFAHRIITIEDGRIADCADLTLRREAANEQAESRL